MAGPVPKCEVGTVGSPSNCVPDNTGAAGPTEEPQVSQSEDRGNTNNDVGNSEGWGDGSEDNGGDSGSHTGED